MILPPGQLDIVVIVVPFCPRVSLHLQKLCILPQIDGFLPVKNILHLRTVLIGSHLDFYDQFEYERNYLDVLAPVTRDAFLACQSGG